MSSRSADEVFAAHLRLRTTGDLEADLSQNYADDVVLLCEDGGFQGVAKVRESAARLRDQLPNARFTFTTRLVRGDYAFLEWQAESDRYRVTDGADSFVIRDGRIRMQSIHYTLQSPDEGAGGAPD